MRNAGLEETQAGIKIAGRNINNLRYADDTTLMAEKWYRWSDLQSRNRDTEMGKKNMWISRGKAGGWVG